MRLSVFVACLVLLSPFAAGAQEAPMRTPDLALRVLPASEACAEGDLCSVIVHVLNEGEGLYEGSLSIHLDLNAPGVLPVTGALPCWREDYGKFRCEIGKVSLAPGAYTVIQPRFLFVATAFESANACASLGWNQQTLAERDRLLADAVATTGHSAADLMKAAGISGGDGSRSRLLGALLGAWGEGDAASANDTSCVTIGIVSARQGSPCEAGYARIGGGCKALTEWCPSNRAHMKEPDRCACPAALPNWNATSGNCEAEAPKLACAAPDADPAKSCRCPSDRPILNAGKGACVAVAGAAAAAPEPVPPKKAVAAAEPAPEPVQPKKAEPADEAVEEAEQPPSEPDEPPVKAEKKAAPPAVKADKIVAKPRAPARTATLEPKRKSLKRRVASSTDQSRPRRRCRALQVWGPHMQRCLPFPVYLMGRLFAPGAEPRKCPAGLHAVNGRCRK